MKLFVSIALMTMLLTASAMAALVNGGFETCTGCVITPPGYDTISSPNTKPDGWFVESGTVDWVNVSLWQPHSGSYSLELNGSNAGDLSQDLIPVVVGGNYTINWWKSKDPLAADITMLASVRLQLDGNAADDIIYSFGATNAGTRAAMVWTLDSGITFTALSSSIKITFDSLSFGIQGAASPSGVILDDISINRNDTGVPEPGTLSLILGAGMLAVGGLLRRRRA